MKRITLTLLSLAAGAAMLAPIKASAQLFEGTPPEGADPAVTDEHTTDPDYKGGESDTEVDVTTEVTAEEEMAEDGDAREMDGEADGEGLEPRFEEENADTLSNE
ncbi:MAG: hypothetical protein AAF289_12560 [Cyanobacteria bacterium P01_A01_bin.135]